MHRNSDLEAAILRTSGDPVPVLVYADWLSEQADPLGELIALQCAAGPVDPARVAMLQQAEIRAAMSVVPLPEDLRLTWKHGFLASIRLRRTRATTPALWPMLEELLAARCSAFVTSLDVALGQFGETPRRFAAALTVPPLLRRLVLRGAGDGDATLFPAVAEVEIVDAPALELAATGPAECLTLAVGQRLSLDPMRRTVVGRTVTAQIVVQHDAINRRNFAIDLSEVGWAFHHLGGTNAVLFNGEPTYASGRVLVHGDRIEPVAGLVFRFVDPP